MYDIPAISANLALPATNNRPVGRALPRIDTRHYPVVPCFGRSLSRYMPCRTKTVSLRTLSRGHYFLVPTLVLLLSALPSFLHADECAKPEATWREYPTPSHEDLRVLPGSDIDDFVLASGDGGRLYAIGTINNPCQDELPVDPFTPPAGLFGRTQSPRFWTSRDSGITWRDLTANVLDAKNLPDLPGADPFADFLFFTAVSSAPDNTDLVVVAGYNAEGNAVVAGSDDGGETFHYMGCGYVPGIITCTAMSSAYGGRRLVAVGTSDDVAGGKVWSYEFDNSWSSTWTDTSTYAGWDETSAWGGSPTSIRAVLDIAVSPSFATDRTMVAVVMADALEEDGDPYEGFYLVRGHWDDTPAWNGPGGYENYPVLINSDDSVIHAPSPLSEYLVRHLARMALPLDFDGDGSDHPFLVAVNGIERHQVSGAVKDEGGYLFWTSGADLSRELLDHAGNPWIASIDCGDAAGEGDVLLGTLFPRDWRWADGVDWVESGSVEAPCCEPCLVLRGTATDSCCPKWEPAERGPSGQFNARVAFSDDGSVAFASTAGAGRVLHGGDWFADESAFSTSTFDDSGASWLQSGLVDTMIHHIEDISYDPASDCLHVQTSHEGEDGSICRCESIWLTCDGGKTYTRALFGMPDVSDQDEDSFEDIMDDYHRGYLTSRTEGVVHSGGVQYLIGDALDEDDEELVDVDFEADTVYRRLDNGGLDWQDMEALRLDYAGLLVLDCDEAAGTALYVGFDNLWWDFTENRPLPYRSDGSDPDCAWGHDCRKLSGAARCLNPGELGCCEGAEWDYLVRGLEGTITSDGPYERLALVGGNCGPAANRLWAIDRGHRYWAQHGEDSENYDWCSGEFANPVWGRLWVYDDCFAVETPQPQEPSQTVIPSDPCACVNEEFVLGWDRPCCACEYELQVAMDAGFRHVVLETEDFLDSNEIAPDQRFYLPADPCHPDLLIDHGSLDCSQDYWWRVRGRVALSGEVIRTFWSEPVRFTTAPGPHQRLEIHTPFDGATRVPARDVAFSWGTVAGATSYDFMLVDVDRGHVASEVGTRTSVILPGPLAEDTPYVWRVLALRGDDVIAQSGDATFRTAPPAATYRDTTQPTYVLPDGSPQNDWLTVLAVTIGVLLMMSLALLSHVNRSRLRHRPARHDSRLWPE